MLHGGKACGRGAAAKWEEVSGRTGAGPGPLWELGSTLSEMRVMDSRVRGSHRILC